MDELSKKVLHEIGIFLHTPEDEILIERDALLNDTLYDKVKHHITDLKKILSSSALTALHEKAYKRQTYPLINLVRQILHVYGYNMIPIRKCDGYTLDGIKKFKRYYHICKKREPLE